MLEEGTINDGDQYPLLLVETTVKRSSQLKVKIQFYVENENVTFNYISNSGDKISKTEPKKIRGKNMKVCIITTNEVLEAIHIVLEV